MLQRLDTTREAGTFPRATPTTMEADVLPGTQMHRVPAEGEHFPDTSLVGTTLPDPPDYDDNHPLTIDKGTLAANLSTETIERLRSVPPVQASRKGSRQLPVAEKAPRQEIREKYEQLMAEKERQKQLEANFQAVLAEDEESMAHIAKLEAKQKRRQVKAAAAAASISTAKTARASTSSFRASKPAASTSGRSSNRKDSTPCK